MADILIPFIHVKSRGQDKGADVDTEAQVNDMIGNERRIVFQFNKSLDFDPSATLRLDADMVDYFAKYTINRMYALRYSTFGPLDRLFITHNMKQIASLVQESTTSFQVIEEMLDIFLEQTVQEPEDFKVGFVLDTGMTVHGYFCRARKETRPTPFCGIELLPDYEIPWPPTEFTWNVYAHYPVEVIPGEFSLETMHNGDGTFAVKLTARVEITENKRAVL